MPSPVTRDFQNLSAASILDRFHATPKGLTDKEAAKRSNLYGFNEASKKKKTHPFLKFLSYFKSPLVIILLIAALISGLTSQFRNSIIIISMVFLSVVLNFYQEHKSNKAAEKIAKKLAVRGTALRDGAKKEILIRYIVPGDIVFLSAGDIVPADGRVIQADDFFVNESVLTGESFPVEKSAADHQNNLVFSGTNVVSGYATFLVVNTGIHTEYGKIAEKVSDNVEVNAFEIGIKGFGYLTIKIIIAIVLAIFLINSLHQRNFFDSLIFSLAVAVGLTPELLPMIMSVNMAKGSINMSKKGVLVKRLNAIPDFGSMDILCTDKTGTLTEDHITLIKHVNIFGEQCPLTLRLAYINGSLETGIKSILDKAILDFKDIGLTGIKKIDEIPYDFIRRRSSIIFQEKKEIKMVTKGAPEEMFRICSTYWNGDRAVKLTADVLKKASALYDSLSAEGLRVLTIAVKDIKHDHRTYSKEDESDMTILGFVAFYDPPKISAKETLVFMRRHGVEIKILTGDSPIVTAKICHDLELPVKAIISGEDLDIDKIGQEELGRIASGATILARLSPIQKERIIAALRSQGSVVGYLGDGINDAPSLRAADVGISVDNAVDVAKETADIILMKKGLRELMDGVLEGRKTFGNTMKYLKMGLSSNFGNMFSMIGAVIYLPFLPMLPGQILLNNFLYDVSQISIPLDNIDADYVVKPRHWDMKFIRNFMLIFGPISSIFDFLTFYLLYGVFHLQSSAFQTGWFIESLATQTLVIYVIRTKKIPFIQSRPSKYLLLSTLSAVSIGFIVIVSPLGKIFGFTPLPLEVLGFILLLVLIYLVLVELVKRFFYRYIHKSTVLPALEPK